MKKIYIAIAAMLFVAAFIATFLSIRSHNRMDDFFRANVDALTGYEDNTLVRNYKSEEKWLVTHLNGSIEIVNHYPILSLGATCEKIKCCFMATDMDGCDFSMEDMKCKQYVERPGI